MSWRRSAAVSLVAVITGSAYAYHRIRDLESRYPVVFPVPPHLLIASLSRAHKGPNATASTAVVHVHPSLCVRVEVFETHVPRHHLLTVGKNRDESPSQTWSRVFMTSTALSLEGRIFNFLTSKHAVGPGDRGEYGFVQGQELLNGLFCVLWSPARNEPLVVGWRMPQAAIAFFEKFAANWGYPFRLINGGVHELGVSPSGDGDRVCLYLASAYEYYIANPLTSEEDGKRIPTWVERLHAMYARYLLDRGTQELQRRAERS